MNPFPRPDALGPPMRRTRWCRGLAALALLGGVLALAACCPDAVVDEIYLIRAPDADLQKLIDGCRAEVAQSCLALCTRVSGVGSYALEHCERHPDSHGYVQVHLGYHQGFACE